VVREFGDPPPPGGAVVAEVVKEGIMQRFFVFLHKVLVEYVMSCGLKQ
jgi:hypothetical protein